MIFAVDIFSWIQAIGFQGSRRGKVGQRPGERDGQEDFDPTAAHELPGALDLARMQFMASYLTNAAGVNVWGEREVAAKPAPSGAILRMTMSCDEIGRPEHDRSNGRERAREQVGIRAPLPAAFAATRRLLRIHRRADGASGAILAFREDIDEALHASIMRVEAPAQASLRPLDEILAAAVAAIPPDAKLERITLPRHARAAAALTYMVESDDLESDFYEIFVNPYTAQVKGKRLLLQGDSVFSKPFIQILMAFHWTLLFGANNAYVVGVIAMLLFGSVLIGLYLLLPRNGDWRIGLTVKWGASFEGHL